MRKVFSILVLAIVAATISVPAHAVSLTAKPPLGLSIGPTRNEVTIAAGTTVNGTLTIGNNTQLPLMLDMYAEAFSVANYTYAYTFLENATTNQWIRFTPTTFVLQPNTEQTVHYAVAVPVTATPGGKYLSLFAATTDPTTPNAIAISERVGSLLYVTIPGDVTHTGKLLGFSAPTIAFTNINWSEEVDNTGANYFHSAYTVSLKNVLGKTVRQQSGSALIISSTIRLVSGQLPPPTWIGLYKINAQFSLGDNGTGTDSRWLLYLPLEQVLGILIIVGVIVGVFIRYHIRRKNNNEKET